jgi:23S rRNA (uracil1939-C5)-methyltransferase
VVKSQSTEPAAEAPGTVRVRVEKLVHGGLGLGRTDQGEVVLVPLAAPGDLLVVARTGRRGGAGRGEILRILEPGPDRREPPCPHFGRCGGCQLMHLTEAAQADAKRSVLAETLLRGAGIRSDAIGWVQGPFTGYRNRARMVVVSRPGSAAAGAGPGPAFGFRRRSSSEVEPIQRCLLLEDPLNERLAGPVPGGAGEELPLARGDGEVEAGDSRIVLQEVLGRRFHYGAGTFFQGNRLLVADLVRHVVGDEHGSLAVDLYCGVGLFAVHLAARFENVVGVEADAATFRFACGNAEGAQNLRFLRGQAERSPAREVLARADLVVLDPPRAGAGSEVVARLLDARPARITYVSCDPATLARDLRELVRVWEIRSVTGFDLFPQTSHIETVVKLALPAG